MNFDNDEEALGLFNRLPVLLRWAGMKNFGSHISLNYFAQGSQYVDRQYNCEKEPHPQTPLRRARGADSPEASKSLPDELATDKAMALWQKAQAKGYVDANYQPLISGTQAALLADEMAKRLGIKEKWKVFEALWNRKYMRSDYNLALTQQQSYDFQDELKQLFG